MIILDEEDQLKQFNGPHSDGFILRYPEKAVSRPESILLPDYEASEAAQAMQVEQERQRQRMYVEMARARRLYGPAVDPRLWKAVGIAFVIYLLLSLVIGTPIILFKRKHESKGKGDDEPPWNGSTLNPGGNLNLASVADVWVFENSTGCDENIVQTSRIPNSLTATTERVLGFSESIYIRSNITVSPLVDTLAGHFRIDVNSDPTAVDSILQVSLVASSEAVLHNTVACLHYQGSMTQLSFYASKKMVEPDFLRIDVNISLALNAPRELLFLITSIPGFSHTVGNLAAYSVLSTVALEGAGHGIHAENLQACAISVFNAYGSVTGTYQASNRLALQTIKGNITTDVTLRRELTNSTLNVHLEPTYLLMTTGDGSLDSQITLIDYTKYNITQTAPQYAFVAEVETFNAPLNLSVAHSPHLPPLPFQLNVKNSNGKANVLLDQNFQGSFYAQTRLSTLSVKEVNIPSAADPLGEDRPHVVISNLESPSFAHGWSGWGLPTRANRFYSQATITSSLAPITLQFGGS